MGSKWLAFPGSTGTLISVLHSSRQKEALLGFMLFTSLVMSERLPLWLRKMGKTYAV